MNLKVVKYACHLDQVGALKWVPLKTKFSSGHCNGGNKHSHGSKGNIPAMVHLFIA
jgi:hypothetical protein